jgi:RNA-directed DNA polymerase
VQNVTANQGKNPTRLVRHTETPIVRHVKVKGDASPYNGNLIYWSSRIGAHPEVPKTVATLLKQQKGKCAHCRLYFLSEDVLEIDHKIPLSIGGKDEYKNLQLLHRHCHDIKTAKDGLVGGMQLDKHQITEEPDEAKVSRPVLQTSRSGDGAA